MRPRRRLTQILVLLVAAALVATVAGCKKQPRSRQGAPATKGPAVALKPVVIDPAPACDLSAEPTSQPRGTLIALYHTANVVGEVEPCG